MTAPDKQLRHLPQRRLVPIQDAKEVLGGIGTTTIYELFKQGKLVKVNIGRRGFVTSESLDAFLQRLSDEAAVV